jgi:tetratricopeptide (TPR) repeat protein
MCWSERECRLRIAYPASARSGAVYHSLGKQEQALGFFNRALSITEEVGDRYGENITRHNMAMIYDSQGELGKAVTELKQAIELARQIQSPNLEVHMEWLANVQAELAAQQQGKG